MEKIDRAYYWMSKLISAVFTYTGAMTVLGAINDLDKMLAYVLAFIITAFVLKESW